MLQLINIGLGLIQGFYFKTPRTVVYFLAGSLPGSALLPSRQLSLFGMIARQNDQHAQELYPKFHGLSKFEIGA